MLIATDPRGHVMELVVVAFDESHVVGIRESLGIFRPRNIPHG